MSTPAPSGKEPSADLKSCVCSSGFTTNTDGTCADIDECAADANTCGAGGVCTNTIGGHACACNIGYAQASAALASPCDEDIDECALGTHTCGHNTCENTVGGFTCLPVDECALGTDTCGETNICGDAPDGFICGQECPNGFVHGSNRTECAETCDTATHMINADNECVLSPNTEVIRTARQQCALAGWQWNFITSTLTVGLSLGQECPIPYRNATTQTDEGGCWISDFSLEKAQREGGATATQYCHNLFDLHGIPSFTDHSEGDRYVYNCPDGREPSADLKSCVCSSGYVENRAGTCVDINECISDANTCEANAQCVNTVGGHACLCEAGYAASSNLLDNPQCGDIDECAMGTHTCGENDICGNTVGGFTCTPCPAGFDPDSDHAECEPEGPALIACPAGEYLDGSECVRFPWTTIFNLCNNAGWQRRPHILYDECVVPYRDATTQTDHEACILTKNDDATDEELRQAGLTATVDCWEFFTNDRLVPQASKHNEGDRYVYNCPAPKVISDDLKSCLCPAGYADISGTCVDINECGDGTHACGEGGVCSNTRGSYTCSCAVGYQSESADTLQCSDVDECEAGTDTCVANSLCANTVGGFVCGNECPSGFAPSADRTECVDATPCPAGETRNEEGTCFCNTETHLPNPCRLQTNSVIQICQGAGWMTRNITNESSYILGQICEIPYRDATAQTDEEGCFSWRRSNPVRVARLPEFTTAVHLCRDLFSGADIPQAANHNEGDRYVHTCPSGKIVSDDFKSCVCPAGWTEDDSGMCGMDIDECATGAHSCGNRENAHCENTVGGHICACDPGYAPSGDDWTLLNPQCADVDECAAGTDTCGKNSLCENTVGGFICGKICADGLFPNPERSECATSPCPAYHKLETAGLLAGQCVCDEDVAIQLSESGDACVPLSGISTVQRCTNAGWNIIEYFTAASFIDVECEIPIRDATREVDESGCYLLSPDNSALDNYVTTATKHCSSVFGSGIPMSVSHNAGERYHHSCPGVKIQSADYKSCVCPAEYAENDEGECVDMDECAAGAHSCGEHENAVCANTVGGHACVCGEGYAPGGDWTFLDPMCGDVNECAARTDDCGANALCANTVGGYLCGKTCPDGLQPNADRTECVPCPPGQTQDETGACICDPETRFVNTGFGGVCHLTSSAATDICRNAGWLVMTVSHDNNSAMGAVCQIPYRDETAQVDETGCSLWRNYRHADNSRWDDYQTTSQRCRNLFDEQPVPMSLNYNEGDRYVHSCPAPKTPSADLKSCECPAGYADDGAGNCVDINECETDAHTCGANAACVNTPGSHACSCSAGYAPVGDSLQNLQCADIDECVMGAHSCGGQDNAYCANTVGDYECSCYVDHLPLNPNDPKNPQCQGSFALTLSSPARGTLYAEYEGITLNVGVNYAPQGATVSVKAQPDAGYYLLKWSGDCANLSAAEPHERGLSKTCKLIANEERQVSATFERAWQAAFEPQPANGTLSARIKDGEPLQSGDIAREGTTVIFTAAPASGYYLLEWGGHCAGQPAAAPHQRGLSQTCELTLNAETTVAATFERAWQTTFNSESANGTLSAQIKDGITLRSGDIVREGTTIIYTAQPDSGFYLLKWGGACAGQPAAAPGERGLPKTCELIADATKKVGATFERAWQTTFNSQPPNGTLSARVKGGVTLHSGDIVREGTTIVYTALPDIGFYLLNWTEHCKKTPAAAPSEHGLPKECELIADEARQVGAAFARAGEITFNPKPPNGALSAQVQDGKTLRPNDVVREGTTVIFTAQPDAGHYLLEWTGDCEDEPDAEPHERGLSKTCELSATPLTQVGATFKRAWQTTFDSQPPNGVLSAETTDGETLQSSDIAQEGTTIIFTAQPDPGFYLSEWGGNCAGQPAAEPHERGFPQTCELTLHMETTIAATFERAWETTFNQPDNGTLSAEIKDGEPLRSNDIAPEGTIVTFTAQPDSGFYLLEWGGNCADQPAAAPHERGLPKTCQLTLTAETTVAATFKRAWQTTFDSQPANGALSAESTDGETLQPGDIAQDGTTIIFTAQPDSGFYLLEWGGHCAGQLPAEPHERGLSQTCELTLNVETTVAATFKRAWQTTFDSQPPNGTLSAETTDGETLQSSDIAQEGTTIIFTAQPDSGFYLLEWGGHCAGQPPAEPHERGISQTCELTLNVETTVAATFKRAWQTTFDSQPPNGTLSAESTDGKTLQPGDIAQEGTTIIFTAQPDSGFYLLEWGGHCAGQLPAEPHERGLSQTCELTLNAETTAAATFKRAWQTTFDSQPDNGALSAETTDGETLQPGDIAQEGTTIIFTAQPDSGFYLLEWGGNCAGHPAAEPHKRGLPQTCGLTLSAETTVAATFERAWETTFNQPDNGTLSAEVKDGKPLRSGDIVRRGTTIIYTALPAPGHYLLEWTDHCEHISAAAPSEHGLPKECELIADEARQVGAIFARVGGIAFNPQPPNGTLSAQVKDGETLRPNDVVREGTTVIFTAQPDPGHYLLEWTGDCEDAPDAEPHERGLSKTCELSATPLTQVGATFKRAWQTTFDSQPPNGALSAESADGKTLQSEDIASEGTTIIFTAKPDSGFYLLEWGGNCAGQLAAEPHERGLPQTCELTLNAETTIAATFERAWETTFSQPDNGTLFAEVKGGKTLQSDDIVQRGTTIIYTAQPDPGHYLLEWTDHCEHILAAAPSEHGIPKECELIADEARQVGAIFARVGEITFNPQPPNGTLSAQTQDGETLRPNDVVREGTTIIFTAQPDAGHYLLEWTDDCENEPDAEPRERGLSKTCELSATPLTQVGATFKRAWQTTFDSQPPNGALSAESADGETLQSGDITQEGTTIIFTAQPDSGFYLLEWGGHCAGQPAAEPRERGISQTCQLTLTAETTVAATFKRAWQTTFDSQPPNGALSAETTDGKTLQSGDIAPEGTIVTFTASPDSGFYLLEWGGHCAGQPAAEPHERGLSQTCQLTLNTETTVAATFERAWETTFSQPDNGTLSAAVKDGKPLRSGDIVQQGTTIIYTAQPDSGHYLLEWTDHCEHILAATPSEHGLPKECELIADEARQVGAVFARVGEITFNPQPPNGTLSAQTQDGETLRPNDVVREGTTIIFTAQPDAGHYLLEWTGDCEDAPDAEPHERGLSKTCELSATPLTQVGATFKRAWQTTFDSQPPNGALSAENTDGETLQPGDIAQEGTTIIFTAQPDSGFYLSEWGGHCETRAPAQPHERGLPQTCGLTLNAETTVAATFERAWETTFSQPDNGTLSAKIKDGETLRSGDIVRQGTTIIYTAQPDFGFYLLEWTDHCEHIPAAGPSEHGLSKECELIADESREIGAVFARIGGVAFNTQPLNGTLSAQVKDGDILRPGDVVREGTTVIFTAQPDAGHYLLEWTGDCEDEPDAEPHERGLSKTCELPATPLTQVGATFKRAWQTTYDSQPANGTLSAQIKDGETLQSGDIAPEGTIVTFTAQPDPGFYLSEWGGNCAGQLAAEPHERGLSKTCELTLNLETTVSATFKRAWETTFSQPDNGTLSAKIKEGETLQSGDIVRQGTTIIYTAQPDPGFYLLEWTDHCEHTPAAAPSEHGLSKECELIADESREVGAVFARVGEIAFNAQPSNGTLSARVKDGETLRPGGVVREGTTVIFTAQPDAGHYLLEWTGDCENEPAAEPRERGLSKTCELSATPSTQVGATFKRAWQTTFDSQPPNGALSAENTDGETLQPGDIAQDGTTIIFTAQPDSGFYLLEWGGHCAGQLAAEPHERGISQTCELTLNVETTVAATFKRAWQTTFDSQPPNGALSAESADGETLQSGDITQEGTTIIFTAQPDSGFYLLEWGGHCAGQLAAEPHERGISQTCELTLNAETTIAATFKRAWQTTYDSQPPNGALSAETTDGKTLQSEDIASEGTTIIFTAKPDSGFYLLEWGGNCAGQLAAEPHERGLPQTCELTLNAETTIAATFERAWETTFSQPNNGTLSAEVKDGKTLQSGDIVQRGTTIIYTAQPDPGHYLLEWTDHCEHILAATPSEHGLPKECELIADEARQVGAIFARVGEITFNPQPPNGTLSAQTQDGETLHPNDVVREGTTIIFTAQPDSGFYLSEWGGHCETRAPAQPHERGLPQTCGLTLNAETTVAATFERAWETTFSQPDNGTLSAKIKDGETLRSGDIVRQGTTIIYTAQPDFGFYLLKWTDHCEHIPAAGPSEHGLSKECELIADESREIGAVFARIGGVAFNTQPLNGTLSAQVKDGDILRPGDVVREGTTVIFTAQPDAGHYLLEWTGDCEDEPDAEPHERGLSKTCELSATPSTQVGATFKRAWQTTFDSHPPNGALSAETTDGETLQSSDIAQEGTTVIFTAQPDSGFYLLEWGGNCAGHPAAEPHKRGLPQTCGLTLSAETTVAATFERAWETTFNQPDNGTLSAEVKDGETLRSGDIVQRGTTIFYTAQPAPGYYLLEWTDHCEHILAAAPSEHGIPKECELIADEARQVGAVFARVGGIAFNPQPPNGTLSAQIKDGETLRPGDVVREGTTVIFTAQPDAGYYLLEWTDDCEDEPDAEPHERGLSKTCELPATPLTQVGATFKRAWQTTFDSQPPNGALSAETTDGKTLQPGDIAQEGTTIIFTAQPDSGFYLLEWGENCAAQPAVQPHERGLPQTCQLTLNAETTVAATFKRAWETTFNQPPNGALSAENADGKTLQSGDIAPEGTIVTFTAQPDSGFYLSEWGGHCETRAPAQPHERGLPQTCGLTLNAETTVAATFERAWETTFNQPDNGTLSAKIKDGETLQSGDIVRQGTTIIYTAQPDPGFYLLKWTDHCEHIPAAAPSEHGLSKECELIANESREVGAVFARVGEITFNPQPPNGTLSAQTQDGETLRPNDVVREGTTVIFTAQPNAGHYLLEWTGDCEDEPDAEPRERGLSKTCELSANPSTQVGATFKRAWQTTFDSQPSNGALSAETTDGETLQSGDIAPEGTTIIFTAQPDSGFYLLEWGENCAGQLPAEPHERGLPQTCELTLHMETTVAAAFERAWQTTFNQPDNGTLSAEVKDGKTLQSGGAAREGMTIVITAQPAPGFYLLKWTGDCDGQTVGSPTLPGAAKTCELTADSQKQFGAVFERASETMFNPAPQGGRLSARIKDGAELTPGERTRAGTTIIFTARPDPRYYLLKWTGDCEGEPAADPNEREQPKECEVVAGGDPQVGAVFKLAWLVNFAPLPDHSQNGTLSARVKGGKDLRSGDAVPDGATVVFTATPNPGFYMARWTRNRAGRCGAAFENPERNPASQTCEAVVIGDSFEITPPAPEFNSSCLPIKNALGDEDNPGKCVCADPAHLIFGEGENRFCAPPTICPTNYSNKNRDCIEHDANPPLPDYANSPEGCEEVFGGRRRLQTGGVEVCSGIDIQGTFCLVGSRDAFPCRGLFKHVRRCNDFNRPALNPFICDIECPGGGKTARGRYCGQETADENPNQ